MFNVEKNKAAYKLSQSIDYLLVNNKLTYFGCVMQCLNIKLVNNVPTAGIGYNKKTRQFELFVGIDFINKIDLKESAAVFLHEVYHVSHKHVFYDLESGQWEKQLLNVAMDLVINQFIEDLPKEAMFLDKFRDKNGNALPENKTVEYYYNALLDNGEFKSNEKGDKGEGAESEGDGEGDSQGNGSSKGNGKGSPSKEGGGSGDKWVNAKDFFSNKDQPFDAHNWSEANGDVDEKEMLEATADLFKRAMQKASTTHCVLPNHIQDMLEEIKQRITGINYRQILMSSIRKSIPSKDYSKTWKRPSRRYGMEAKGNITAPLPYIHVLLDTSGSISIEEGNQFLEVLRNFLTIGVAKAKIHLFHTSLYHSETVKKGFKLNASAWQSGGTDLTDAFQKLTKERCDLLIVLTDGYYSLPDVNPKKLPQTIFVIPENCNLDHPTKHFGKTIKYKAMNI